MTDRPTRLLLDSIRDRFVDQVSALPEAAGFEIVSYVGQGAQGLQEAIRDVDAAYIYQDKLSGEAIRSAPNLRFIQKHGLNCKNIDVAAATERGIPVATLPLLRNAAVAEHALALMLACAHKIVVGHRAVAEAVYREMNIEPMRTTQNDYRSNWAKIDGVMELMGASVGIVGLGDIGMEVAKRCRAFGMNILYHQREPYPPDVEAMYQARYMPLDDLLESVDYLVLILPHTPETDGMIGRDAFARMKPTSTLINVARGGVVDEDALVDALVNGQIAMAGLDVYREEPLPASSSLCSMTNVVLAPHTGGGSYRSRTLDRPAALANIARFFRGEPTEGIINLE
jgi:phosphoglycerate dehydrogenase-like enzyme